MVKKPHGIGNISKENLLSLSRVSNVSEGAKGYLPGKIKYWGRKYLGSQ